MGNVLIRTVRNIKNASASLMIYEIFFKLFIALCFIPGVSFLFNFSLKLSGYQYITKRNMVEMLTSPVVLAAAVIIILVAVILFLIEISSLTLFFGQNFKDNGHYLRKLFFLSLKEIKRILNPKNIRLFAYVLVIIPVLHFIIVIGFIVSNIDVSSQIYKSVKQFEYYRVFIFPVLLFLYLLLIRNIFVFCFYFIEKKGVKESFLLSKKLIKGKLFRTAGSVITCNLFFVALYLLFYLIVIGFVSIFTKIFGSQQLALTIFLSIFNFTNQIIILLLSSFEILLNISLTVNLYLKYSHKDRAVFPYTLSRRTFHEKLPSRVKKLMAGGILLLAVLNTVSFYFYIKDNDAISSKKTIGITSHRGSSVSAPENTIYAIQAAIDEMADYAEIDVQQTKDGTAVILHDPSLKRVTGVKANIWTKTYDEIKDLDAGSWFSPEFADARIPTLEEVIRFSKGRIKLNIEIKPHKTDKKLEKDVVRIIEENDFEKECVVTSFNYGTLTKIKKLNPKIKTGCIMSPVYGKFYDMKYSDFYSLEKNFVTPRMVYQIHQRGKEVHVWTVNSEYYMNKMEELGVDNIITDDPVLARNTVYSKNLPDYTVNFLKMIFDLRQK